MGTHKRNTGQSRRQGRCKFCEKRFGDSKMFWKRKFCSDKCRGKFFYKKLKDGYESNQ